MPEGTKLTIVGNLPTFSVKKLFQDHPGQAQCCVPGRDCLLNPLLVIDDELDDRFERRIDPAEGICDIIPVHLRGEGGGLQFLHHAFHVHAFIAGGPDQRCSMDEP